MIYIEQFWDMVYVFDGPIVDVNKLREEFDANFPKEPQVQDYQPEYPLLKYNAAIQEWFDECKKISDNLGVIGPSDFSGWLVKNHGFKKVEYISI